MDVTPRSRMMSRGHSAAVEVDMSKTKKRIIDIVSELKVAIYIRVSTKWQIDLVILPLKREELP